MKAGYQDRLKVGSIRPFLFALKPGGFMPDEVATIVQPTQESGPSESAPEEQVSAETAAESTTVEQTTETTEPDIWTRIVELDPKELLEKHPKLAGKLGEMAQKQADKKAAEERVRIEAEVARRETEREAKREQEELDRLLEEEPATYIDKVKEHKDKEKAQAEALKREQTVAQGLLGEIDAGIFVPLFATLPEATQTRLQGKEYQGNHVQSRRAYVEDLLNELVEHRTEEKVKKEKEAWEKKDRPAMREALRKEILAEINGGEETPDLGSGSHGNGKITWAEVQKHRGNQEWFNKNIDQINADLGRR